MRGHLAPLLQPLNLAALLTLVTVAVSIHGELRSQRPLGWALLVAFSALFLLVDTLSGKPWLRGIGYTALAAIALALVALAPRTGTSPVLLVILVAALAIDYPSARVLAAAVLLNLALYLVLRAGGHFAPAMKVTIYLGFQAFAALVAHYARSAEQARDRLALVNADLLATRALLADSARHGQARMLDVRIRHDGPRLAVSIEDDGRMRGPLREGNGLAGMRERLAAADGQLAFSTSAGGALRIDASLPA